MEIKQTEIYTTADVEKILKISHSTMLRLLKSDKIHAVKVGKQYRIMGKEILRLVSPEDEQIQPYQPSQKAGSK